MSVTHGIVKVHKKTGQETVLDKDKLKIVEKEHCMEVFFYR